MSENTPKLTFIGVGNMAKSIIGGLIENGYPAEQITLCAPTEEKLAANANTYGTPYTTDNCQGCKEADVIVLAVKPGMITQVCAEISSSLKAGSLVISVAAGITLDAMQKPLPAGQAVVRCMPNTPSQVLQGASGLFANTLTSEVQRKVTESIMGAVGITCWVSKENLIDSVTAVSGSGPAYYFLMMEAMIAAGEAQGLDKATATELTLQTALGAAMLAKSSEVSVDELRRRVTSPNGTTEQAIKSFEANGIRNIFSEAMDAARARSESLAKEFSQ